MPERRDTGEQFSWVGDSIPGSEGTMGERTIQTSNPTPTPTPNTPPPTPRSSPQQGPFIRETDALPGRVPGGRGEGRGETHPPGHEGVGGVKGEDQ